MTRLPILLDSTFNEIRRLHPDRMQIIKQSYKINSTQFDVPLDETPSIGDWLNVYSPAGDQGLYRINRVTKNIGQGDTCTVYAQSAICTLNDDFLPETEEVNNVDTKVQLKNLLNKQTKKLWQLGDCAISGKRTYVVQKSTLLEAVVALVQSYGVEYMIKYDFSAKPWKLNVVKVETDPSCECRLSRNLQSVKISIDRTDMANKLYLTGETDKKGKPITPVPFVKDDESIRKWGVVSAQYTDAYAADNSTIEKNAKYYLQRSKEPIIAIQLDAVQLANLTGETLDSFECGKKCRVALPDYGIVENELITGVAYGDVYGDETKVTLTLANRLQDASTGLTKLQSKTSKGSKGSGSNNSKVNYDLERNILSTKQINLMVFGAENTDDLQKVSIYSQIKMDREQIALKVGQSDITFKDGKLTIRRSKGNIVLDVPSIVAKTVTSQFITSKLSILNNLTVSGTLSNGDGTFITSGRVTINSNATFSFKGYTVSWKSETVMTSPQTSKTIYYLGR